MKLSIYKNVQSIQCEGNPPIYLKEVMETEEVEIDFPFYFNVRAKGRHIFYKCLNLQQTESIFINKETIFIDRNGENLLSFLLHKAEDIISFLHKQLIENYKYELVEMILNNYQLLVKDSLFSLENSYILLGSSSDSEDNLLNLIKNNIYDSLHRNAQSIATSEEMSDEFSRELLIERLTTIILYLREKYPLC